MKKRTFIAGLVCSVLVLMTACESSETKNDDATSSTTPSQSVTEQQSVSEDTQDVSEDPTNADPFQPPQDENETHQERVIVSFQEVEGAVIYDTEYDENGFPVSCQFHKKCESCGYVSNTNGQARGNLTTSYHCDKCGNNQCVEIAAIYDFVEVMD